MTIEARKIRLIMTLRREGITDTRVLSAMERVPREIFISNNFRDKAYDNTALPIGKGQTISQPFVVAYMTQALQITDRCRVLEIGTGSGYQASILSHLARRVYTIERHKELSVHAVKVFEEQKIHNITYQVGDGYKGWPEAAPFDRIIVTAAAKETVPQPLIDQLAKGGRMVVPVRVSAVKEQLVLITRSEEGELSREDLIDVRFVPLVSERDVYDGQKEPGEQHG